jgi:hypothetical protein
MTATITGLCAHQIPFSLIFVGMGRSAKLGMLVLIVCTTLAAAMAVPSAAQGTSEEIAGPEHPAAALRAIEIEGIRLGLTPEEATAAMGERGYEHLYPEHDGGGFFRSPDALVRIQLGYAMRNGRELVDHISYYMSAPTRGSDSAFLTARGAMLARLGPPTYLHRWVRDGGVGARFTSVSDRRVLENVAVAGLCFADWQCTTVLRGLDCRAPIERVRGVVIDGGYTDFNLFFTIDDYGSRARALLRDRAFREQDTRGATCIAAGIH